MTLAASAHATVELGAGLGRLLLDPVTGSGLRLQSLGERLEVRFRAGGESLRPVAGRPRRALRNLFQEAGIVPWMRPRLPLLYCGGKLIAVADLWLDADFAAGPGEEGLQPRWENRPGLY
jgi:tRNA(Ile)-lysidine synthase